MTPEEAIHELEIIKNDIATYEVKTSTCFVKRWSMKTYDTFEMAKGALEKQIPKKPDRIRRLIDTTEEGSEVIMRGNCHSCGKNVDMDIHRYCPSCGQRLDWSEVGNGSGQD